MIMDSPRPFSELCNGSGAPHDLEVFARFFWQTSPKSGPASKLRHANFRQTPAVATLFRSLNQKAGSQSTDQRK